MYIIFIIFIITNHCSFLTSLHDVLFTVYTIYRFVCFVLFPNVFLPLLDRRCINLLATHFSQYNSSLNCNPKSFTLKKDSIFLLRATQRRSARHEIINQ